MYKRNSIKKLGRKRSHRDSLIKNQLRSIMQSGKVRTSSVKAKVLKGEVESLFSKIKKTKDGDILLLRNLSTVLGNKELVKKALEIGKKEGTKVTIKKIGFRPGDNTEMSIVEISGFKVKTKTKKDSKKEEKEVKEEIIEERKEQRKGILNLGKKSVSKKVEPVQKVRAKARSGL